MRCVFISGHHSIKEFWDKYNITKDMSLGFALNYEAANIRVYLELKRILNIDDELFNKILNEIEEVNNE